jgi:hypothetical protein
VASDQGIPARTLIRLYAEAETSDITQAIMEAARKTLVGNP